MNSLSNFHPLPFDSLPCQAVLWLNSCEQGTKSLIICCIYIIYRGDHTTTIQYIYSRFIITIKEGIHILATYQAQTPSFLKFPRHHLTARNLSGRTGYWIGAFASRHLESWRGFFCCKGLMGMRVVGVTLLRKKTGALVMYG